MAAGMTIIIIVFCPYDPDSQLNSGDDQFHLYHINGDKWLRRPHSHGSTCSLKFEYLNGDRRTSGPKKSRDISEEEELIRVNAHRNVEVGYIFLAVRCCGWS